MKIPLHIEKHDKKLGFEIAGIGNSLKSGTTVDVPGGAKLEYQGTYVRKAFGIPEILQFIVDASVTIDLGLFSTWLYDQVKDKPVEKLLLIEKKLLK